MESVQIRLPEETVLHFTRQDGRVEVDLNQQDFHRHYLIEAGIGYELHKGQRFELDAEGIEETIDLLCLLINNRVSELRGEILFSAILKDLVVGRSLRWLPEGIRYFDGDSFVVFQTEAEFERYFCGADMP